MPPRRRATRQNPTPEPETAPNPTPTPAATTTKKRARPEKPLLETHVPKAAGGTLCTICGTPSLDNGTGWCDECGGYTVCTRCHQDGPCTRSGLCAACLNKMETAPRPAVPAARPTPAAGHPPVGGKTARKNPSESAKYRAESPDDGEGDEAAGHPPAPKRKRGPRRRRSSHTSSDEEGDDGGRAAPPIPLITAIDPGQPAPLDKFQLPRQIRCASCHCYRPLSQYFTLERNAEGVAIRARHFLTCRRDRDRRVEKGREKRDAKRLAASAMPPPLTNGHAAPHDGGDGDDDDDDSGSAGSDGGGDAA